MNVSSQRDLLPDHAWVVRWIAVVVLLAIAEPCVAFAPDPSPALTEILRSDPSAGTELESDARAPLDLPPRPFHLEPLVTHRDPAGGRRLALAAAYAGLYGGAAKLGSRLGLERDFKVVRLESAWAIDVFGHIYAARHTARAFAALHRWAGDDARSARRRGAWYAGFGALTYMEAINGFMPGVRFDWLDPLTNAAGAWLADGGEDFGELHAWTRRLSFELGYKSWGRLGEPDTQAGAFTRLWHDYPNMRYGVGYGVGPVERPWVRIFATYGVTSLEIEELRNQFGMGMELAPHHWLAPLVEKVPMGARLLAVIDSIDRHVLVPGLYIHLFDVETGPFTGREPFDEGR